jgi:hypothetical protein
MQLDRRLRLPPFWVGLVASCGVFKTIIGLTKNQLQSVATGFPRKCGLGHVITHISINFGPRTIKNS